MQTIRVPLPAKAAISILLVGVALSRVDVSSLLETLHRAALPFVLLAAAVNLAAWLINSYKWQWLLANSGVAVPYRDLFGLNLVGTFYSMVLPGQIGGEVMKGVRLFGRGVAGPVAAVSILADRLTGLLALVVMGIVGVLLSPALAQVHPSLFATLVVAAIALGTATVYLTTKRGIGIAVAAGDRMGGIGRRLLGGLSASPAEPSTRGFRSICIPLLLSLAFQVAVAYANLMVCLALGIEISFPQLLWVVTFVSLLQSLPISIAGMGVREGSFLYLLQQQGVDGSKALAMSLTVFAIQILMAAAGGVLEMHGQIKGVRGRGPWPDG